MSPVDYTVVENPLRSGEMFLRVVPKGTIRTEKIVTNIARRTLIQPVDVEAVLDALDDEVVDGIIEGNNVIIDGFLGFSVSISLNIDEPITDPQYQLQAEDVIVNINVNAKYPIVRRVRDRLRTKADFNKTKVIIRTPQILFVEDWISNRRGVYTPGNFIEIGGEDLDLPDNLDTDLEVGVFFVDSNGAEYRSSNYREESNKKIICLVPVEVAGKKVDIIVRTNYGFTTIREGKIKNINQA